MKIKNIIFDIGGVLVNWNSKRAINNILPSIDVNEVLEKARPIFKQLSLGQIEQEEAVQIFINLLSITEAESTELMLELVRHQKPIKGTIEIITKLNELGLNLYLVTDNTKEFVQYYKKHVDKYVFMNYFKDIANSADLGVLKPDPIMYNHILLRHNLNPAETVYVDDIEINVKGAADLGVHAFLFTTPEAFAIDLSGLGIDLT